MAIKRHVVGSEGGRLWIESLESRRMLDGVSLAVADVYTLPINTTLQRGVLDGILANDAASSGGTVRIAESTFPQNGRLTLGSEGQFVYEPNADFAGIDRFTYRAFDGQSMSPEIEVSLRVGRYADLVLAQMPLAYWRLNEDSTLLSVHDSSSSSIHGEFRGEVIEVGAPGAINAEIDTSVRLGNGGTTSINFGDSTTLMTLRNNLTVEAWVKPLSLDGHGRILGTSTTNAQGGIGFGIFNSQLIFTTFGIKDYISPVIFTQTDQWYHVAAVFDATNNATFYLNGDNVGTVEGSVPASDGRGDVVLGSKSGFDEQFNGWLDEVAIYGESLTSSELMLHYQMGTVHRGKIPVAVSDSLQVPYTRMAQVVATAAELVANDRDTDSADLSVQLVGAAQFGSVSQARSGDIIYESTAGFRATDTFAYVAFDGMQASSPTVVELHFYRVIGDANEDGTFDSSDLTEVFQRAEYEDGIVGNSTYADGDWNGDGEFDSGDLVLAFQSGNYVSAALPAKSLIATAVDWLMATRDAKQSR